MPNHVHGILIINDDDPRRDVLPKRLYEYDGKHPNVSKISPTKKSISTALRFFKRQTTASTQKLFAELIIEQFFYTNKTLYKKK